MFCKKDAFKTFVKFTGKHLHQSLFFNKVVSLRPATLSKKRLWHRCFPVNVVKFFRTGYTKVCNHPQAPTICNHPEPPKTIHNYPKKLPQPPTTISNHQKYTQKCHNLSRTGTYVTAL